MTATNPTAPVLTDSQKNWSSTFSAYKSRIGAINAQLQNTPNLTAQAYQTLMVQRVETEIALRQHFELAYRSSHLTDLYFQYQSSNPKPDSYIIGHYVYSNDGIPTHPLPNPLNLSQRAAAMPAVRGRMSSVIN